MLKLIQKDVRQLIANKTLIIFCLCIILALGVCFIVRDTTNDKNVDDESKITLGIVNKDVGNKFSKMLIDYFKEDINFSKMVDILYEDDEKTLEDKMKNDEIAAYLIIPEGFVDNIMHISQSKIKVRINGNNTTRAVLLENVLKSYESFIYAVQSNSNGLYDAMRQADISKVKASMKNTEVTYKLIAKVMDKGSFFDYEVVDQVQSVSIVKYYFYAILIIFIMYMSLYSGIDLFKERLYGVLNRYKVTGASTLLYVFAKFVCSVVITYGICFFVYLVNIYVRKENFSFDVASVLLFIVMSCVAFSICMSFYIYKFHTFVLSLNMIYMLLIVVGGIIIPLMYLPNSICKVVKYLPTYQFINSLILADSSNFISGKGSFFSIFGLAVIILLVLTGVKYQRGTCDA